MHWHAIYKRLKTQPPIHMDLAPSTTASSSTQSVEDVAVAMDAPAADSLSSPSDDAVLMLRYRSGDLNAFETLYARHKAPLYRYLMRMCRDAEAANDLFQEVWGKVIASRERYEARAQFSTFLYRIAHNCTIDYFRRSSRVHEANAQNVDELADELPGSEQATPEAAISQMQMRAEFRRALDELPAEQRDVFVLYEETGLSLEEIGKITGVAMETAKSRLRYAVSKLRTALRQHQPASAQT